MAKNTLADWDTTAANNTDVGGISLAENVMRPPAVNNAFREVMAQIKSGAAVLSSANTFTADQTITSTDAGAAVGPQITLLRNSASPAALDNLGRVLFSGKDTAGNTETYAQILATITDPTSTSEDGTLRFATVVAGVLTTGLTVSETGVTAFVPFTSLGIDDNATGERVQVSDSSIVLGTAGASYVVAHVANDQYLAITGSNSQTDGANIRLYGGSHAPNANDFSIRTDNTDWFYYDDSASTLTITPALNVTGNIQNGTWSSTGASAGSVIFNNGIVGRISLSTNAITNQLAATFSNPNGQVGSIATTNSATTYNTSSDERLKEGFVDFDAGQIIDAISIYEYTWKVDGSTGYGPKAQELHTAFPAAVTPGNSLQPGEEGFEPWAYDASKLVPLLVKEVQALRERLALVEAAL